MASTPPGAADGGNRTLPPRGRRRAYVCTHVDHAKRSMQVRIFARGDETPPCPEHGRRHMLEQPPVHYGGCG
jgi:hypothetical protein